MTGAHRHPKTRQAKVVAAGDAADGIPPRGKRTTVNIVDHWDDKMVAAREDRSWKKFRKDQFKPK